MPQQHRSTYTRVHNVVHTTTYIHVHNVVHTNNLHSTYYHIPANQTGCKESPESLGRGRRTFRREQPTRRSSGRSNLSRLGVVRNTKQSREEGVSGEGAAEGTGTHKRKKKHKQCQIITEGTYRHDPTEPRPCDVGGVPSLK